MAVSGAAPVSRSATRLSPGPAIASTSLRNRAAAESRQPRPWPWPSGPHSPDTSPSGARCLATLTRLQVFRAFHTLGILDLVVAVTAGVLAAPGLYQVFAGGASTEAMTAVPLVLVPAVLVPLSVAIHLTVLRRLPDTPRAAAMVVTGG